MKELVGDNEIQDESSLPETAQGQVNDKCLENGNIAPCIDEEGNTVYYCDDPEFARIGELCMPSPQEWANFQPIETK